MGKTETKSGIIFVQVGEFVLRNLHFLAFSVKPKQNEELEFV